MTQIEQARTWSPRVISKFETLIRSGDEVSVDRANPLAFARDRGVAEPESIDLFLHAARAGLVDMHWDILCPHSGLVLESFEEIARAAEPFRVRAVRYRGSDRPDLLTSCAASCGA
jgi:hypothetical protein